MTESDPTVCSKLHPTVSRVVRRWPTVNRTLLMVVVLCCAGGQARPLPAQTHVVPSQTKVIIAAGAAAQPRTDIQFQFAIAAATGWDDSGNEITDGLVRIQFNESDIEFLTARARRIDYFIENGVPVRAEIDCTAVVQLRNGRRFRRVPIRLTPVLSEPVVGVELDLGPSGVVAIEGSVFSGGSSIEAFEPESLVVALGGGSTVPSDYQAAAAFTGDGRAMGRLSLLANPDNGNLVRVDGLVDFAAVGALPSRPPAASGLATGKRQHKPLTVMLSGMATVDVFRPDGTSPDTCFGDFEFVAHEGPHGPYRIDAPDCRDPLAGIEGTDIGSDDGFVDAI